MSADPGASVAVAVDVASWICLLAGSMFCLIGGVGMLRLPDFYTRGHAAGVTDTLGAGLILLGLMFQAGFGLRSTRDVVGRNDVGLVAIVVAVFIERCNSVVTDSRNVAFYRADIVIPAGVH